jgi:HK97 family phage prohead protease
LTKLDLDQLTAFRVSAPVEVKLLSATSASGEIEGYGSTFGGPPDSYGHVVERGAFAATLARHQAEGTTPAMLWSHDPAMPVGRWDRITEDGIGLKMAGRLNLETQAGRDALAHLKARDVGGLSIGFTVPRGGRAVADDGTIRLLEVDLHEVSLTAIPANRRARITDVKNLGSQRELEVFLHEAGLSRGAAVKLAAGGWARLAGEDPETQQAELLAVQMGRHFAQLKTLLKG